MTNTKYYKVLSATGRSCHGGDAKWFLPKGDAPGKWMPRVSVCPCMSGYHVARLDQLHMWLGPRVYEAELDGYVEHVEDKSVGTTCRLLKKTHWNERRMRLFLADCVAHALLRLRLTKSEKLEIADAVRAARSGHRQTQKIRRRLEKTSFYSLTSAQEIVATLTRTTDDLIVSDISYIDNWMFGNIDREQTWRKNRLKKYFGPELPTPVPLPKL